jgi:hypothetical protein
MADIRIEMNLDMRDLLSSYLRNTMNYKSPTLQQNRKVQPCQTSRTADPYSLFKVQNIRGEKQEMGIKSRTASAKQFDSTVERCLFDN